MARIFPETTAPYIGGLSALPINLGLQKLAQPNMICATVPWANYGSLAKANVGVFLNMEVQPTTNKLDRILSVYIDNTENDQPVYVKFLDTGFTISCPPNSVMWQPAITKLLAANVYCEGFTGSQSPTTTFYFLNVSTNPFSNSELPYQVTLYKQSQNIPLSSSFINPNYGTPGLCDQSLTRGMTLIANSKQAVVFPVVTGFVYLNILAATAIIIGSNADNSFCTVSLQHSATLAPVWQWNFINLAANFDRQFPTISPANLKLDATLGFELAYTNGPTLGNSAFILYMGITTNPN